MARILCARRWRPATFAWTALVVWAASCGAPQRHAGPPLAADAPLPAGTLELAESYPVETSLDDPGIPDAWQTWMTMIGQARQRIDIAQFYVVSEKGSRLDQVLAALEASARRGVAVRLLVDAQLCATYPDALARLEAAPGIAVRRWRAKDVLGGILHAKYFLVDGQQAWLGSQNFDWRSLIHIHELGLRLRVPAVVDGLQRIFEADWALAAGGTQPRPPAAVQGDGRPVEARFRGETVQVALRASPKGWLPDPESWDLPHLIRIIDAARRRVRLQLLSYHNHGPADRRIDGLEAALRQAGARGVEVEVLLSHWTLKGSKLPDAQRLQSLPGVTVRVLEIPEARAGSIPFARVIHAKYLVADGAVAWLGTSNWGWGYFHDSRNVGVEVGGAAFAAVLDGFFARVWHHPAARPLPPPSRPASEPPTQ